MHVRFVVGGLWTERVVRLRSTIM